MLYFLMLNRFSVILNYSPMFYGLATAFVFVFGIDN